MAGATSLYPVFWPQSIAVIGASRDQGSLGFALLHNLVNNGFAGPIFPVNPKARVIHSLKCYSSVEEIPDPVDLAVILVPRPFVDKAVEACISKGVRGLVVITAGYRETGESGAVAERQLRDRVRGAGMRMIGPNCMGIINTDPAVSLNATFAPVPARCGSIAFVSQSGALGVAILNVADRLGIGLTQFVSIGNKADVSGNDLLELWEDDDSTHVIAMYLESFGNPRRFTQLAKRVSRKKPILIVKSGRTAAGARAASSHTGAMAGLDVTVSAFLSQCGVIRANSIEELFDIARALDRCPRPRGDRVGIVTNAGGPGIMATDACSNLGLQIAELSPETRVTLKSSLPAASSVSNPVDMLASASAQDYGRSLSTVLSDPEVDMALVIHVTPLLVNPSDVLEAATRAAEEAPEKPVLAVIMATEEFYQWIHGRSDLLPVYRFPESAALALSKLVSYGEWRRRPEEPTPPAFDLDDPTIESCLGECSEGYLSPEKSFQLLEACGIPVARRQVVASRQEVLEAGHKIGFPVVLKAIAPELVHKSELGGVRVDLRTMPELSEAVERMTSQLEANGVRPEGFLIQEYAQGGHEVIFGISTDPRFGPLLMFGLGGKYVEVFRDVRFAVTPVTQGEAEDLVRGVRGLPLLEGVRGEKGADLSQLVDILLRLAHLVERYPCIRELDINPFLAGTGTSSGKALDARILVSPVESAQEH